MEEITEVEIKDIILEHLENRSMAALKQVLLDASMHDILGVMQELNLREQAVVFRLLSKEQSLNVFEQLDIGDQEKLIGSFSQERAYEIIEWLDPDDRVRLLDELPAVVASKMLAMLPPEDRAMTNLLMGYEEETAGRIMTPQYVSFKRGMTVEQALEKVKKQARDKETIYTLYVVGEGRRFEGVLSLRDLLTAKPADKIEDIMETNTVYVSVTEDQEEVARTLKRLGLLAIPVVDKEERLVGIITVDDAMDVLEDEATEDMLKQAGLIDAKGEANLSETLTKGSIWAVWKIRMPFLLFTLVGGLIAGFVMGAFEDTLETILMAAFFIPVVLDMGGSTGVQSATIFTRASVLGHIDNKRILKHMTRETFIGFTMGVFTGIICALAVYAWQGVLALALAVGFALVIVMTFASFIGFMTPYVLVKLKMDQAAASGAIITTIKDISGLLIYFALVTLFVGQLM